MNHANHREQRGAIDWLLNAAGIAAPVAFVVAVAVTGALHPNYSHVSQPISALAARDAPYRGLMIYAGFLSNGLLTVLFSVAVIRRGTGSPGAVWSGALLAAMGLGRLLAGVFPLDPASAQTISLSARLHVIVAMAAMLAGSLSPLAMAWALRSRRRTRMLVASLAMGAGALGAMAVLGVSMSLPTLRPYAGLFQRLTVGLNLAWTMLLAIAFDRAGLSRASAKGLGVRPLSLT